MIEKAAFAVSVILLISITGFSQNVSEIGGRLGFSGNGFVVREKNGFSRKSDAVEISLFFTVNGRSDFQENQRVSVGYGLGIMREYLGFYPLISFKDIPPLQNLNADTLIVAEVANWDWQFTIPVDFSFQFFDQKDILPPFIVIPSMRINVGVENKFTFNRINTDNIVLHSFDEETGIGFEYYDELTNQRVSDYYSDKIKKFKVLGNVGLELFQQYSTFYATGGIKFNRYIFSPISSPIANRLSLSGYVGIFFQL